MTDVDRDKQRVVLVTGAGSGMGHECALDLAERGWSVYGSVLNDEEREALGREADARSVRLSVLQMDITRPGDIAEVMEEILASHHRIDALVQFAGMGLRGFFEDLAMDEIRHVFEVNVFGAMALTQAVLPHMRERRSGRIILTTSVAGRMGTMSIAGYAASKFAVEGFAECLAQEVAPFGIFVSLLEPGLILTPHFTVNRNRARRATDPDSPYYAWFCQHEKIVDGLLRRNRVTTRDIAILTRKILTARRPKLRYLVGAKAKIITSLRRHIPGEIFERAYFGMVRRFVTSPRKRATGLS